MHEKFFEKINATPHKVAAVITGGGTEAIGQLLRAGGAGATMLYFHTPYHPFFTTHYLGQPPEDGCCSIETAQDLASRAYQDALMWKRAEKSADPVVGIGATSSLGKIGEERPDREHNVYIAFHTETHAVSYRLFFKKWLGRLYEEKVNAYFFLALLAESCDLVNYHDCEFMEEIITKITKFLWKKAGVKPVDLPFGIYDEQRNDICFHENFDTEITRGVFHPNDGILKVFSGASRSYGNINEPKLFLPTSMNPLHEGHMKMAAMASQIAKADCCYELSVLNVDKPAVSYFDLDARLNSLPTDAKYMLSDATTFVEKAELYGPNAHFAVGADTAARICSTKYYPRGSMKKRLQMMKRLGTKFICFAREINGTVLEVTAQDYPVDFMDMAIVVPTDDFVSSASSTQERTKRRKK